MSRRKFTAHVRATVYAIAALLVPGGVPFGLVDREPPAAGRTRHRP